MKRALKKFGWALLGLFILFQIYFSVRVYWLVSCTIPTYSMSPTLVGGDYILVSVQIPGRRIYKKVSFTAGTLSYSSKERSTWREEGRRGSIQFSIRKTE